MTAYLNAYTAGNRVKLFQRTSDGRLVTDYVPAEYSAFVRSGTLRPAGPMTTEGDWDRLTFPDYDARRAWVDTATISTFEGDVTPVRRLFTDRALTIAAPRTVYLDIETDSRVAFKRKEEARILSWALVAPDGTELVRVLTEDTSAAERALLSDLWDALAGYDQVLAWNGDGFDFPVILARTAARGLKPDHRRLLWLDHLALFRRMNSAESGDEKQSFKLESVCQSILGYGKSDFDGARTWDAWVAGGAERERMVAYNLQDTRLLLALERKTGFVALFQSLAEACSIFPDSKGLSPSAQVDGFMLRLGSERGLHFPTRLRTPDATEKFRGAYVMPPNARGIVKGVHVGDFTGLYPSIIRSWNMSPETKRPAGTTDCAVAPDTGILFDRATPGVLPEALAQLAALRKQWQERQAAAAPGTAEWWDAGRRSTAYKVAANSFYGVIGAPFSRYFDREIAESVTQTGAWLIKQTMAAAEREGMNVNYGDSVTGDRVLVTKDPQGRVRMLAAEVLWASGSNTRTTSEKVRRELPGWTALSSSGNCEASWRPIDHIVRHRAGKTTCRITTKHGQCHVTADHGIMVDGKPTAPAEFVAGNMKFTALSAPKEEPDDVLDLFEAVRDFEYAFNYKGRRVSRRFELVDEDWFTLGGWGNPSVRIRRWYKQGSAEMASLVRLVAAYVSDGSASIRGVTAVRSLLTFCKADLALQQKLAADLGVIATDVCVWGPAWSETVYIVRSASTAMTCLFAHLCGQKSRGKRLPHFMFALSDEDFTVFRDGLAKGDGYVDAAGQLTFSSTSQSLTASISYVFSQREIEHSIHFRESKEAWSLRTRAPGSERNRYSIKSETFAPRKDEWVYDLSVPGAHNFVDGIGRVLLHNTDSLLISGSDESSFRAFVDECNATLYPRLLTECRTPANIVKLAYEKEFERFVIVSAKKYVGRFAHYKGKRATADSRPEVKGLEWRRGDTNKRARELQWAAIERLMVGREEDPAAFHALAADARDRFMQGPLDPADVIISKSLGKELDSYATKTKLDGTAGKEPAHVVIARAMAARGEDVTEGTRIEYVMALLHPRTVRQRSEAVAASSYEGEVDRAYYWEQLIWPPTERLLAAAFPDEDWGQWGRVRARGNPGQCSLFGGL